MISFHISQVLSITTDSFNFWKVIFLHYLSTKRNQDAGIKILRQFWKLSLHYFNFFPHYISPERHEMYKLWNKCLSSRDRHSGRVSINEWKGIRLLRKKWPNCLFEEQRKLVLCRCGIGCGQRLVKMTKGFCRDCLSISRIVLAFTDQASNLFPKYSFCGLKLCCTVVIIINNIVTCRIHCWLSSVIVSTGFFWHPTLILCKEYSLTINCTSLFHRLKRGFCIHCVDIRANCFRKKFGVE